MKITNKKTIFIVEDTADIRMILEQFFQIEGFEVAGAANGAEALEMLNAGLKPDLMVVDLLMPVMDGFRLCESLRKNADFDKIPVVIMTGDCHAEFDKAKALGKKVLRKPMNFKSMLNTVEELLHPPAAELESRVLQNQNNQSNYRSASNDARG